MEMAIDREDFDFEIFEDDDVTPVKKTERLCPQCSSEVTGRLNKIFCTPNCRKWGILILHEGQEPVAYGCIYTWAVTYTGAVGLLGVIYRSFRESAIKLMMKSDG